MHRVITENWSQEVKVSKHRGPPSISGKRKSKESWETHLLELKVSRNLTKNAQVSADFFDQFIYFYVFTNILNNKVFQTTSHRFYLPPGVEVTPVSLLQPLDPGVALLRRPRVSHGTHFLCNVGEYVPVADTGFQAVLHVICSPQLNKSDRLLLRPCCVHSICTCWWYSSRKGWMFI